MTELQTISSGIDQVVAYPQHDLGEPMTGVVSIEVYSTSDEATYWVDGRQYLRSAPTSYATGTIETYNVPKFLLKEDTNQLEDVEFDISYQTKTSAGRQIHLIYGAKVHSITFERHQKDATLFSMAFSCRKIDVPYFRPAAHFIFDLSRANPNVTLRLEEIFYGNELIVPTLPPIKELLDIFEEQSVLIIYDHGDGSWSAQGPDEVIRMVNPTTFSIDWPSASYISPDTYRIHSL